MIVLQHGKFARAFKRLHPNEKRMVEDTIKQIMANPVGGELKKGDLSGAKVHKFTFGNQLKLLAYSHTDDTLTLLAYGSHENFYRDLKT